MLRKGDGLCHGTAGNAYSFLALYQANKVEEGSGREGEKGGRVGGRWWCAMARLGTHTTCLLYSKLIRYTKDGGGKGRGDGKGIRLEVSPYP